MKNYSREDFLKTVTGLKPSNKAARAAKPKENEFANKQMPAGPRASTGLTPYAGTWGQTQIMHLLRRSLFGVSKADYDHFASMTLTQCLDALLTPAAAPSPPINTYNDATFTDPDVPALQTWVNAPLDTVGMANPRRLYNLKYWWIGLMINQDRSLTEKMTLFWHNHFATQILIVEEARAMYHHHALLRANALGNFKTLTRAITTDPAMLVYLNGNTNTKTAPNENYGRELQELFTVGKGPNSHYTEDDVKAAARVLTGWNLDFSVPTTIANTFIPTDHDTNDKQFSAFYNNTVITGQSGANGALETDQLINMIFSTQEVAMFMARKLYRWFVYYVIDTQVEMDVITPLANVLISNNFDIAPALRALLGSEHFFDPLNIGCHIKNPVDHVVGMCRQLNIAFPLVSDQVAQYNAWKLIWQGLTVTGLDPGDPPNVAGWPAYYQEPQYHELWINTDTIQFRNEFSDGFSNGGINASGFNLVADYIAFASQFSNPSDPNQLIADSVALLSANDIGATQTAFLKTILLSGQAADHYWTDAWNQYIANPTDAALKSVVNNRLIYMYAYLLERAEYQLI